MGELATRVGANEEERRNNSLSAFNSYDEEGRIRQDIENIQANAEYFGDKIIKQKHKDTLRLSFLNVNGLPSFNDHVKNERLFNALKENSIDIIGMAEVNTNWGKIDVEQQWRARTRPWWEASKTITSYNIRDCSNSVFQPGGTLTQCINRCTHKVIASGTDSTGLGRWSWVRFRGSHEISLTVITAYRPCKPSRSTGVNTTYVQQVRYFDELDEDREPREAILEDLSSFITQCHQQNDQIILMMDVNQDVATGQFTAWLEAQGLNESIASGRPTTAPPTYHRGSRQIDGIFTSASITAVRSGFLEFGVFPSDHRALWLDISYHNAFGCKMQQTVRSEPRRLRSDNPTVRNRWISHMSDFVKTRKLDKKLKKIERHMQLPLSESLALQYENILQQREEGWRYADKKCRKLKMGAVPFSPTIKRAGATVALWEGVLKKKRRCVFSQSRLRQLEKDTGIRNSMHCTVEEAQANLRLAKANHKRVKKDAKHLREKFLEEKAKAIAEEGTTSQENVYKQLIQREKQRESSRRIKYVLHKVQGKGVTKVEIHTQDNGTAEITSKEGIERACLQENKKKYLQIRHTPCLVEPLKSELGWEAQTLAGEQILEGTYQVPDHSNPYTQQLFDQLKTAEVTHEFEPAQITSKVFADGWKKMNERTSAGISGLHFGHLKSCAKDSFLSSFEASIANIPYTTGYSPANWSTGVSVMLHKKEDVDLVTKLRTITLLEADFNFNNKVLGRATINHAEKNNLIAKEQYGSRPGKQAIDHAVHKALTYDIIRQYRVPSALCSNDAKSCYDRVAHAIASLAYRRLGVPDPPVSCMLRTIQNMKHHVQTTFGDSKFYMSADGSLVPFQGVLQGNGASPASWVIISTALLNMLRAADRGGHFISAISGEQSHSVAFTYVDDTDLIEVDLRDTTIGTREVMEQMQNAINQWEGGLKVTGGAIVPQKSFVYPIAFEFDAMGKWKYCSTDDIDFNFTVKDHNDTPCPLTTLSPSEGRCTLGVVLAPDGGHTDAIKYLKKKSETWAAYIKTGHISRLDAWQALDTTIVKTLRYPMPALCLTEKECNQIMSPVLQACLPKSSLARTYPHAVLYGPKEEGGLDHENLYLYQGTSKILLLTEHLAMKSMTGELLRCSIEAAKVEVGIGRNIFTLDYDTFGGLCTDGIVKTIWKFSFENGIIIEDNVTPNLDLHRDGDLFLMEQFAAEDFTATELAHINRCRLYLQVTTLSDIMEGHGHRISRKALRCEFDTEREKHYRWPVQNRPHQGVRRIWKRAIKRAFPRQPQSLDTQYTLGPWLNNYNHWKWYFHPITKYLYKQIHDDRWVTYKWCNRAGAIGRYPNYRQLATAFGLPLGVHRATVESITASEVKLTGWADEQIHTDPFPQRHIPPVYKTSTNQTNMDLRLRGDTINAKILLAEAIANHQVRIVSDGSFLKEAGIGTAAFIVESFQQHFKISGSIRVPGHRDIMCSYRAELAGILAAISYINAICHEFSIHDGTILLGCDGKEALNCIIFHEPTGIIKSQQKHFDLLTSISHSLQVTTMKWNTTHVKGHQDDLVPYRQLDRLAQLNVQADKLAKRRLTQELQQPYIQFSTEVPFDHCKILRRDNQGILQRISTNLNKTLHSAITSQRIRQYWIKKHKFEANTERHLDWEVIHKSFKSLPKYRHRQLSKWLTGFCGVGKTLVKYGYQDHSKCPRCNADNENVEHVLTCPDPMAKATWDNEIRKLKDWLVENDSHPVMADTIINNLKAWHSGSIYPATYHEDRNIRKALHRQDRIGWHQFVEGFIAKEWRKAQEVHLQNISSQKSPTLWMSRLQQRLWSIMKAMWDDRNHTLHGEGNAIHQHEMTKINQEIMQEWQLNLDLLPANRYQHLFRGTIQDRINDTIHQKQQWLCSIWTARDRCGTSVPRVRDTTATNFYSRWKAKLIFQRETKIIDSTIVQEWNRGIDHCAPTSAHLFEGTVQQILGKPIHVKKRWIFRVWEARDSTENPAVYNRNEELVVLYQEWQLRQHETP